MLSEKQFLKLKGVKWKVNHHSTPNSENALQPSEKGMMLIIMLRGVFYIVFFMAIAVKDNLGTAVFMCLHVSRHSNYLGKVLMLANISSQL